MSGEKKQPGRENQDQREKALSKEPNAKTSNQKPAQELERQMLKNALNAAGGVDGVKRAAKSAEVIAATQAARNMDVADFAKVVKQLADFSKSDQYKALKDNIQQLNNYIKIDQDRVDELQEAGKEIRDLLPFLKMEIAEDPEFSDRDPDATLTDVLREGMEIDGAIKEGKYKPLIERSVERKKEYENSKEVIEIITTVEQATEKRENEKFFTLPTSATVNWTHFILTLGKDLDRLPDLQKKINHGTKCEIEQKKNRRKVTVDNKKSHTEIILTDLEEVEKLNKGTIKLFIFALKKANEQIFHNGELTRDCIFFPLKELVNTKDNPAPYKTIRSARKGFLDARDALVTIKMREYEKRKNGRKTSDNMEVLFTGGGINGNQCYIRFNYAIDWRLIMAYYTQIPSYCFSLSAKASVLLFYIFYLARQRGDAIKERGYFTISFRAIQARLNLPDEKKTKNPQRDIKERIDTAVTEMEDAHKEYFNNEDFQLELIYNEKDTIKNFLDQGYLKVILRGEYARPFIKAETTKEKKIEDREKKQRRIEEKAQAMKLAKETENDTQKNNADKEK